MYSYQLHQQVNKVLKKKDIDIGDKDNSFYARFMANIDAINDLYIDLYGNHPDHVKQFEKTLETIAVAFKERSSSQRKKDNVKLKSNHWFLSNELAGMSLYVDRFCGDLTTLCEKLPYFSQLGVNLLHLMPIFQSPEGESDGGYAVSNFRKVDERFGDLGDLRILEKEMSKAGIHLMIDIVLNHTSHHHEWAEKAKKGDKKYQDYFYMYDDRHVPNQFDHSMPEIFPESSPGNFTYVEECNKWVMTVFHHYQWDLNYTNPAVFREMLENIFFYANLGVDILRIDAPAFIWKQVGTTCQNLPQAHVILRLIKQCVEVAAPGMALLGEAIVAPREIMKYFGEGMYTAKECDFAYNATQMALQWDALATGDTKVMMAAQHEILRKPFGTSWITYTRCHDDIGLGYDDYMIEQAGYNAYEHRKFLKDYYSGTFPNSYATGALFSFNPKTQDARISGSLASLCGLEKALADKNDIETQYAIRKILMMQAHSFFIGGLPMIFYGDESAHLNDYSYLNDPGKSYDNRWMHRPVIDWEKNENIGIEGTIEQKIFSGTKKLLEIRKKLPVIADHKNLSWLSPQNSHVIGYKRYTNNKNLYCLFNFSHETVYISWYVFSLFGTKPERLYDYWRDINLTVGEDDEYLVFEPYDFYLLENA